MEFRESDILRVGMVIARQGSNTELLMIHYTD